MNEVLKEEWTKTPDAYQDLSQDNSQTRLKNLRKTRLTLKQINKLRQLNDIRAVEYKEKLELIKKQYGQPAAPPGGM